MKHSAATQNEEFEPNPLDGSAEEDLRILVNFNIINQNNDIIEAQEQCEQIQANEAYKLNSRTEIGIQDHIP
jgi:hypothetical protein